MVGFSPGANVFAVLRLNVTGRAANAAAGIASSSVTNPIQSGPSPLREARSNGTLPKSSDFLQRVANASPDVATGPQPSSAASPPCASRLVPCDTQPNRHRRLLLPSNDTVSSVQAVGKRSGHPVLLP